MGEARAARRGELFWVDWSPARGSEAGGRRPALVVQRDAGNSASGYPNTVVVAVSSQGREIPLHVRLRPSRENGLRNTSFVKCEQIFTISKERLGSRLGRLRPDEMENVDQALRLNLALEAKDDRADH
ncbi:MAG: type II toxin-antitoxin system PemK/MazF family toxin [Myxococcaceae bacterium]